MYIRIPCSFYLCFCSCTDIGSMAFSAVLSLGSDKFDVDTYEAGIDMAKEGAGIAHSHGWQAWSQCSAWRPGAGTENRGWSISVWLAKIHLAFANSSFVKYDILVGPDDVKSNVSARALASWCTKSLLSSNRAQVLIVSTSWPWSSQLPEVTLLCLTTTRVWSMLHGTSRVRISPWRSY
jgi:hypothetical protein